MDETPASRSRTVRLLWVVLVVLAAALVGVVAWQVAGGGDDEETAEAPAAEIVSVAELREAAADSNLPIYWDGPIEGAELELSEPGEGRVYVRYLTGGAEAGDPRPAFLAIGTYALPEALAALKANAKRSGARLRKASHGAFAWVDPQSPTSVYLARPGGDFQIEVYDPSPQRALKVALSPGLRTVTS